MQNRTYIYWQSCKKSFRPFVNHATWIVATLKDIESKFQNHEHSPCCCLFSKLKVDQDNDMTFQQFFKSQVADLVDKLGRAVVQRDEHLREKSKAQAAGKSGRFGKGTWEFYGNFHGNFEDSASK